MASNHFGEIFRITTWGESHGKAIGVVIDGCPAGLPLCEEDLVRELRKRAPGKSPFTSPRKEEDQPEILSGIFAGVTTGTPISLLIWNRDADSSAYEPLKHVVRPGHAHLPYLEKYGIFDHRGGGRSSGRETACRVAAGAVAKKLLLRENIGVLAFLEAVGTLSSPLQDLSFAELRQRLSQSALFCPYPEHEEKIMAKLAQLKEEGDSIGGIIGFRAEGLPIGLGDPVYRKLEALLAFALLSIPASKGWEIGEGFQAAAQQGSSHNDPLEMRGDKVHFSSNHAGGTLGGISNGMPLWGRVAFKPTSSIRKEQATVTVGKKAATIAIPPGGRHDPCIAIRAVPVVEAMVALVLADALLLHRCARL